MPKLKPSPTELKNREVLKVITGNMAGEGIDHKGLCKIAGFCETTYRKRMRHPETFTLLELRRISTGLKFSDEEKAMIV